MPSAKFIPVNLANQILTGHAFKSFNGVGP
jgi:hypothetical protein